MTTALQKKKFIATVSEYYRLHGRHDLPWRETRDPYAIAVSEVMLQQTQVGRVIEKYHAFLTVFPAVKDLAQASLGEVLQLWSGLGYNRRAKFLKGMAEAILQKCDGVFPHTVTELENLPGIGPYTARAIATFAYNQPHTFIETNIRTVYTHHFFADTTAPVHDKDIMPIMETTLDSTNPRTWYWALMDYGSYLKSNGIRINKKSTHYIKQSTFAGSRREVRGMIIKLLGTQSLTLASLGKKTQKEKALLESVLLDLMKEGFVQKKGRVYSIVNK